MPFSWTAQHHTPLPLKFQNGPNNMQTMLECIQEQKRCYCSRTSQEEEVSITWYPISRSDASVNLKVCPLLNETKFLTFSRRKNLGRKYSANERNAKIISHCTLLQGL
uniref:Uncharacterized protein n=1 Tax=Oryza brachyantha TaxID=4533 RepID=J3LTR3_ORYBR